MSNPLPKSVLFGDTKLKIVDHAGRPWLAAADLARALEYQDTRQVSRLYRRHKDEFTPAMTAIIEVPMGEHLGEDTRRGVASLSSGAGNLMLKVRIFNARGCYLIAVLTRTERAKQFRRWVLDVLEAMDRGLQPMGHPGAAGMATSDPPGSPGMATSDPLGEISSPALQKAIERRARVLAKQAYWQAYSDYQHALSKEVLRRQIKNPLAVAALKPPLKGG